MTTLELTLETPAAFAPLLAPARYKGSWGGRGGGKSHDRAEAAVELMVCDPNASVACLREVQRSLKFSVKRLVERKIRDLGVSHLFTVLESEIRRNGGEGVMIFAGMQDHTADSIKSLEGFDVAWFEEAQNMSARSMQLLLPTIRKPGSELWFTWNPEQPTDPIDQLLRPQDGEGRALGAPDGAIVVHANFTDNPFCPDVLKDEARRMQRVDPDAYAHVWLGAYNTKSKAAILGGKYVVEDFKPAADWEGPYFGADWGFAEDPTVLVKCWVHRQTLYVEREAYRVGLELDDTAVAWLRAIPGADRYVVRADSARPESISYVRRNGFPRLEAVQKWTGSVEDGIAHLRSYDRIVIHPRCEHAIEEARLYSYKVDRQTGDILPDIVDKHNHIWDAVRYSLAPRIKATPVPTARVF